MTPITREEIDERKRSVEQMCRDLLRQAMKDTLIPSVDISDYPNGDFVGMANLLASFLAGASLDAVAKEQARIRELEAENAELKAMKVAVQETPKQWSTANAPTMEAIIGTARGMMAETRATDLKAENIQLEQRVRELESALKPFAKGCEYADAELGHMTMEERDKCRYSPYDWQSPTYGDCRHAAAVLAKGHPQ